MLIGQIFNDLQATEALYTRGGRRGHPAISVTNGPLDQCHTEGGAPSAFVTFVEPPLGAPRVETRSDPKRDERGERDGGQEVAGKFVVARCNVAEVLETAERVLDQVTVAIAPFVINNGALSVGASWNDGNGSLAAQGNGCPSSDDLA